MENPAPGPVRRIGLLGRASEFALLDGLIEDIRRGEGRSLVLRGEAGIGKTALLQYLIESAPGFMVVRAVGVESEMELAYAGLHQLCGPLLDRLPRLPAPQLEALEIVFGLSAGAAPDRFLVGLGVLSLFSEVSEERPLLCVIDDAQWLDQASALTLAFVARRLLAEPVGIVFAAREPGEELQHVPELKVRGLSDRDARALLGSAVRFRLDERVRERIIAETRGNPLALLELPRGLTATQLAGGLRAPWRGGSHGADRGELRSSNRHAVWRRSAAVAARGGGTARRSAAALARGRAARDRPRRRGRRGRGRVARDRRACTFRHPLVRSAVYRSAAVEDRRAVHLALAEVTDRETDPDRRAWHLAAAAAGPDENVALELERSAGRAQARGGLAAAAAFLQRAVALTDDPTRRAERALAAAHASLGAGAIDAARDLLAAAKVGPLDELQRARLDLLRAEAAYSESRGSEAPALLLRAAKTLDTLDPKLARETYLDAWSAALFAGRLASTGGLHHVSRDALAAPRPAGPPRPSDLLLDGFARAFTDGRSAAAPILERAAKGFATSDVSTEEVLRWGWLATAAAVMVWDYETCLAVATRGVQLAREVGALTVLAVSVNVLTQAVVLGGQFDQAALLVAEADSVTEATGTRVAPYGALVLGGLQGRESDATRVDRPVHPGVHCGRTGNSRPIRTLGEVTSPQWPRPLCGGADGC